MDDLEHNPPDTFVLQQSVDERAARFDALASTCEHNPLVLRERCRGMRLVVSCGDGVAVVMEIQGDEAVLIASRTDAFRVNAQLAVPISGIIRPTGRGENPHNFGSVDQRSRLRSLLRRVYQESLKAHEIRVARAAPRSGRRR